MNEYTKIKCIAEKEQWDKLVALLRAQGLVRESDLHANHQDCSTKGRRLFWALREWGCTCRMLGGAQMKEAIEGESKTLVELAKEGKLDYQID